MVTDQRAFTTQIPARDELRLAVAMNGGVSLAVWIGGVATELERFRTLGGAAEPWRNARQQLGIDRVVIDVLAGSSAGGLNAVFLALAQALEDVDLGQLRDVWFELADFDTELLRSASARAPRTPLDGDYFLHQLQSRLAAMVADGIPSDRRVDLRVTATSLRGQNESVPDATGSNFVNRRHDVGFRFHTNPGGGAGDFSDTTPDGPLVRNLATAGRASASFPVAFEPVLVDPTDFGRGKGVAEWLSEPRYLADGGILDNLPVGPAVKAIFHQPADEPITRVLLAVIPLHQEERPDAGAPPVPDEPSHPYSTFSVTWSAGVTIPRNETIAAELRELERLNRDSGLLINARTVLLDRPFDELVATGRGLWPVYVRQHMALVELAAGDDEQPPWLPPDPWVRPSRRSGTAVRRAAAVALDVLTRVNDGDPSGTYTERLAEWRRRVYHCIHASAELDPYDPEDQGLASTRGRLFALREAPDGTPLDVGADLGALFDQLAVVVGEVAPIARSLPGLGSLAWSGDDGADHHPFHWLTAMEVAQGALGPSVNPQSMVHPAIVSPARKAPLDPFCRTIPGEKLAGDDLGHFGAFLKRAWRANDWMWGRLDAASALGAICQRLGLDDATADGMVRDAQRAIVREEAPAIVRAVVYDLDHGARSPKGCELINDGEATPPSRDRLDALREVDEWDAVVELLGLPAADAEAEFLRRLALGQETVKDELRSRMLIRVGTRFAAVMTKTAMIAGFPSLLQRLFNVVLVPLRFITAAAARIASWWTRRR